MASLDQLYELQELDRDISELGKSLQAVNDKLADDSAIVAVQRRIGQLDAQIDSRASGRREHQFSADQIQEKLTRVNNMLYGGSVTSSRELTAFGEEKGMFERQLAEAEDMLLEIMVELEELQIEKNGFTERLNQLETQWAVQSADLSVEKEKLETELAALQESRQDLTPGIPPLVLGLYESLLKTRDGYAVARVDRTRGLCEGCRVRLPANEMQKVRTSDGTVQCNNCRRILYMG